jgi:hypothetical protein
MNLRSRLTYANVVATVALFLAIGGGTVYAALELSKNSVKSKNIAKGAVKTADLGKKAVTSPKVRDGTIKVEDIAAGVIPKLDADVTGSATAGPQGGVNTNVTSPLPLSGTTSFTPSAGDVSAVAAEARFTIATTSATEFCNPAVSVLVNGEPSRIFVNPESGESSPTPVQAFGRDAAGPYGLINPGTPLNVTAELRGDVDCTAGSRLEGFEVRILQIR